MGERFEGLLPPVVAAPMFAIRKPAVAVFTLDEYVVVGVMTSGQAVALKCAMEAPLNILVAGATSTGKTRPQLSTLLAVGTKVNSGTKINNTNTPSFSRYGVGREIRSSDWSAACAAQSQHPADLDHSTAICGAVIVNRDLVLDYMKDGKAQIKHSQQRQTGEGHRPFPRPHRLRRDPRARKATSRSMIRSS